MNNYNSTLILHALDESTSFLSKFKTEFNEIYFSFNSDRESIWQAKSLLGDLEPKSLIVYLGHGSSRGLYEPANTGAYEKYFLDVDWGNHYFEKHDIFLLSCKSNEFIKKIYKSNYSFGFGNIISSLPELSLHNENNEMKLPLSEIDIVKFNEIYVNSSLEIIKKLINNEIYFSDALKYMRFMINKEINHFLLNKNDDNRIYMSKLLFDFRNEILILRNPHLQ